MGKNWLIKWMVLLFAKSLMAVSVNNSSLYVRIYGVHVSRVVSSPNVTSVHGLGTTATRL